MNNAKRVTVWIGIAAAALVAACQTGDVPPAPSGDGSDTAAAAAPPLTMQPARVVVSNVTADQLAFAVDHGTYRGGYATHSAQIVDGIIAITPRSFDARQNRTVTGGTMTLETSRISIGDSVVSSGAGPAAERAPNAVAVQRGDVTELISNREDGIEQTWEFASMPEGDGDLTVEVVVSGEQYTETTRNGLHFKSDAGLGFVYSNATWLDSAGGEWEIPARYEDGRIVMTVPGDIARASTFPATLDPVISGEILSDTPAIGTLGTNGRNTDVASDGTNYFVVWNDQRASLQDDIYGARITAAGVVTDTTGIVIHQATGVQQNPTVAFVGNGYVVAWEDVVAAGNSDIEAAFVSTSGTVTQLGAIASTAANETAPAIASNGTAALLVWQNGTDVLGAVYSGSTFGAPFSVAATADTEKEPAVAASPAGNFLVTFSDTIAANNDDIRGQLVTAGGALSGTVFNIGAGVGNQNTSAVDFDGTQFLVAWTSATDVFGARVTAAGVLTDTTALKINGATGSQINPDVSCHGTSCMVVWEDTRTLATTSRDIYGGLVNTSVTPMTVSPNDVPVTTAPRTQTVPAIALAGTQWLSVWTDAQELEFTQVRGARISSAGVVTDNPSLTLVENYSRRASPAIAQTTLYTDLVFSDSQIPDLNILHVRYQTNQLDNPPKVVSNAVQDQLAPTEALVGTNFVAAWQDDRGVDRDIYMARINPSTGAVIDASGVAVTTATGDQLIPKMASGGSSALVVWQDRRNGATTGFDIYGALVSSAGTVTVTDISICQGTGDQTRPSVAYDATNNDYLVVWADPQAGGFDIRGARVSATGTVIDTGCGTVISAAANNQFAPSVAWGGNQFFVAWEDRRNDTSNGDIYAARVNVVSNALNVIDTNGIAVAQVAGSPQSEPVVAYSSGFGGGYLVVWTDGRNQATTGLDIWGSRVSTTGAIEAPYVISSDSGDEHAPAVSPGSSAANAFNIAYARVRTDLNSERIQFRHVQYSTSQVGTPCSANTQCSTGFCSDGVCCNTACGGIYNVTDCQACSVTRGGQVNGTCGIIAGGNTYACRDYSERPVQCDIREYCDGVNPTCPADLGTKAGQACTVYATGLPGTCPANDVSGAPHKCQ